MFDQPDLPLFEDESYKAPVYVDTFGDLEFYQPTVVALSGAAGSGKSTASAYLATKGYTLVKFAGPLKEMCRAVGLTDAMIEGALKEVPQEMLQGKTPRQFMQWLGTEFGRDLIGPNFWTDLWRARVEKILSDGGKVVTDDCRFANEAAAVRRMGGDIYRLVGRGGISGGHSSEKQDWQADVVIENTGTIEQLHVALDKLLQRYV
jgi:hypothetical protein